ncbi:hypothetical protein H1R20_g5497, partial [Candolleomyces eurysporus]
MSTCTVDVTLDTALLDILAGPAAPPKDLKVLPASPGCCPRPLAHRSGRGIGPPRNPQPLPP